MVVEDEPDLRTLVDTYLRSIHYSVLTAANSHEALNLIRETGTIDLLLADVGASGINPVSLVHELERCQPGLNVLFMSGYSEDHVRRILNAGNKISILRKPFSLAELRHAVAEQLRTQE